VAEGFGCRARSGGFNLTSGPTHPARPTSITGFSLERRPTQTEVSGACFFFFSRGRGLAPVLATESLRGGSAPPTKSLVRPRCGESYGFGCAGTLRGETRSTRRRAHTGGKRKNKRAKRQRVPPKASVVRRQSMEARTAAQSKRRRSAMQLKVALMRSLSME